MIPTEEECTQGVKALLPRGLAWAVEDDSNLSKLLSAFGLEFSLFHARVEDFINSFFPDTTIDFLTDWERIAGLPDPCSGLGASVAIRQADLKTKLTGTGGATPSYFIALAAALGYTITITEFNPFRVNYNAVGDALYNNNWQFHWQVNGLTNTVTFFKVNVNSVGDALSTFGNGRLECVLNRLKPAHTVVFFNYS